MNSLGEPMYYIQNLVTFQGANLKTKQLFEQIVRSQIRVDMLV